LASDWVLRIGESDREFNVPTWFAILQNRPFAGMSKFDIQRRWAKSRRHERFAARSDGGICPPKSGELGDYETASEVVREGLRLLKQRDEVWKADVRNRIKQGMDSIRAGRTIPAEKVQAEMTAFKKKWKKNRNLR
jgi:putative addiction module CopG family antidote